MRAVTETLLEILGNADITYHLFSAPFERPENFDLGLRMMLVSVENAPYETVLNRVQRLHDRTFYHLQDAFFTHYAIFKLPDEESPRWLSVGPMLIYRPSDEQMHDFVDHGCWLLQVHELQDSVYFFVSAGACHAPSCTGACGR